ncbi:GtrA family protein [Bacillus sp. 165]|uniref:GtrA family protein n=1 Tax=Bacillus sp. 165 TaxID=1529117 RepID=UPI001AD9555B|nr:GtrA family protein [Bacillus sp. 165]MBO9131015.1 GtrA family protein [Bacillus sp. 165]
MKKKEIISYLVFGGLTTVINIVVYVILTKLLNVDYRIATTVAWVLAVVFAFITNKLYVFNSKETDKKSLIMEFSSFVFFRIVSYGLDFASMIILVSGLKINDVFAKIAANVVVVIFNYFASKYVIFKTKEQIEQRN